MLGEAMRERSPCSALKMLSADFLELQYLIHLRYITSTPLVAFRPFLGHQEARLGTNPESLDSLRPLVALAFRSFGALIERESEGRSRLGAGRPARQNGGSEGGNEDACARAPKPKPILPLAPMLMNLPSNQPPILGGRDISLVAHHAWDGTLFYALLCCNNGMGSE